MKERFMTSARRSRYRLAVSGFTNSSLLTLTCATALGIQPGTHADCFAAQPADADSPQIVGWKLNDPLNHAESREYFGQVWAAEDAGQACPSFAFTNPVPGLLSAMLAPEHEVFTAIYSHRLNLDLSSGEHYGITDLLRDDPEVQSEFRVFVLTGELAPQPEVDIEAYLKHYALAIDGLTAQSRCTVDHVQCIGSLITSDGMKVVPLLVPDSLAEAPTESTESEVPDMAPGKVRCVLEFLLRRSLLGSQCMRDGENGGIYRRGGSAEPDFDCDDFADAVLRFMLRRLTGWSGKYGLILAYCGGEVRGHAIGILIDPNGKYWWVDPLRSDHPPLRGPFDNADAALADAHRFCFEGCSGRVVDSDGNPVHDRVRELAPEGLFGVEPTEGKPWYTNPDLRQTFCARLAFCCERHVGFGNCVWPAWALPLRQDVLGCDIADYLPIPWNPEWGKLLPCNP